MTRVFFLCVVLAILGCGSDGDTASNGGSGAQAGSAGSGAGGGAGSGSGGTGTGGVSGDGGTGAVVFGVEGWSPSSSETPHYFLQPDDQFRIHPARPRLLFRAEDVPWIQARIEGPLAEQWDYLGWMAESMAEQSPSGATATDDVKGWFGDKGQAIAFLGHIEKNQAYIDWAVAWAKALGAGEVPDDDTPRRARAQRIALVYDWLHDEMSDEDREQIRADLIKYTESLAGMGYIEDPAYVGGHERWGYGVFAMCVIALAGDWDGADALVLQSREHIAKGFFPTQAWIAADGGYHMGWAYSGAYTNFDLPYLVWTVGTNDVVLDDWISENADYYLYGMRGDDKLPEAGDAYSISLDQGSKNTIYGAGIGKNPYAKWFLTNKLEPTVDSFLQVLSFDPELPSQPPDDLPKGRLFSQAGVVVARDAWDASTTHFTFKSGSFFSTNHHHRDENGFMLHYKGVLAIDSGVYDSYGSTHWDNYYTRTIAHNGIVVFDPAQDMKLYGASVSNDGGQIFKPEPRRLEDIQPGGDAALDGILRFEDTDAFTYAWGDATRAYDAARVTLAQREVVYLRDTTRPHPVILIFDRVGATDDSFQKKFLLHTSTKPSISGKLAVASAGGGRLSIVTLLPSNAAVASVGGSGKEFWVDGQNYPPTKTQFQPGAWRLEVSPTTAAKTDYLLHALFVDDDGATAVTANDATAVSGTNVAGAELAGWTVVFPKSDQGAESVSYVVSQGGSSTHLVAGLPPGQSVTFSVDGANKGSATVGPGGCASLTLSVSAGATVLVE